MFSCEGSCLQEKCAALDRLIMAERATKVAIGFSMVVGFFSSALIDSVNVVDVREYLSK